MERWVFCRHLSAAVGSPLIRFWFFKHTQTDTKHTRWSSRVVVRGETTPIWAPQATKDCRPHLSRCRPRYDSFVVPLAEVFPPRAHPIPTWFRSSRSRERADKIKRVDLGEILLHPAHNAQAPQGTRPLSYRGRGRASSRVLWLWDPTDKHFHLFFFRVIMHGTPTWRGTHAFDAYISGFWRLLDTKASDTQDSKQLVNQTVEKPAQSTCVSLD